MHVCTENCGAIYTVNDEIQGNEAEVSALLKQLEARKEIRGKVFRRVDRFLAQNTAFFHENHEMVVTRLLQIGFSEEDFIISGREELFHSLDSVFLKKNALPVNEEVDSRTGNSFLLSALENLGQGENENIQKAINFAKKNNFILPAAKKMARGVLPEKDRNTMNLKVLTGWSNFAENTSFKRIIQQWFSKSEKSSDENPRAFWKSFDLSIPGRSSFGGKQVESSFVRYIEMITPENKRSFEAQTVSDVPLTGYFLVAQTNILRE
ncbi:MAG: hypothetical protein Q4C96_08720 [Planctomycetia bacterium]|nr:hypothetical protein [Planctomycetia bacterium]